VLWGNALRKRGQPLTARKAQRENIKNRSAGLGKHAKNNN